MSSHTALPVEPLDILIMGAGVSGIGAAAYLRRHQPHKRFAILESRERMGGTWDLFRYPGIRSDSDLYTFGFDFKPWTKAKSWRTPQTFSNTCEKPSTNMNWRPSSSTGRKSFRRTGRAIKGSGQ